MCVAHRQRFGTIAEYSGILLKILQNRAFAMSRGAGIAAPARAIDAIDKRAGLGGGTTGLALAFD
jgi:hypothetical protein